MKKTIVTITALTVLVLSILLCSCNGLGVNIEGTTWKLQVAQKANPESQEIEVIARSEDWITEDNSAPVVNMTLVANDGKITLSYGDDAKEPFFGTYKKADVISYDTIIYSVSVKDMFGNASVSLTKGNNGDKTKTLILTLFRDDIQYTLTFTDEN